jgi:4-hydroxy-3-methylbut-2-en-1-yl diphosphate synthase IspG/GcpE
MGAMDLADAVPGIEFARRTQHKRCHEHCVEYLVCPTCSALTHVQTVSGRWDEAEQHTARPFDPVAVTLFCGHVFGDMALARPGVAAREAE